MAADRFNALMMLLFVAGAGSAAAQEAGPAAQPYVGSGDLGQLIALLQQNALLIGLAVLLLAGGAGLAFHRGRPRPPPPPSPAAAMKPPPPSPYGAGGANDAGLWHYFVSHASDNAAEAMKLVKALEDAGLRCWIAPRNIRAGETYGDAIGAAVARLTKATLVLVSPQAEASAGVKSELELARRYNHPIVPVILNNHPPGKGMLYYIGTSHWLPFDNASPATIEALVDAVRD